MTWSQIVATALSFASIGSVSADVINVVSWNLESDDAKISTLAPQVEDWQDVDIWGLSEVHPDWFDELEDAAEEGEGADFRRVYGSTGGNDRLMIVYDDDRFDVLLWYQIHWTHRPWYTSNMKPRSALVAHMRETAMGAEFIFMVNHLYRGSGDDPRRQDQARGLNEWARAQSLPVIATGDYNFDWDVDDGENDHSIAYDAMVADSVFTWVRPDELMTTQGDPAYNSVLDFVFVNDAGWAKEIESEIIESPLAEIHPSDKSHSDHRPILTVVSELPSLAHRRLAADRSQVEYDIVPAGPHASKAAAEAWLNVYGNAGWVFPDVVLVLRSGSYWFMTSGGPEPGVGVDLVIHRSP